MCAQTDCQAHSRSSAVHLAKLSQPAALKRTKMVKVVQVFAVAKVAAALQATHVLRKLVHRQDAMIRPAPCALLLMHS